METCSQYAIISTSNLKNIGKHPERIAENFINQYKWKERNFPAEANDWKKKLKQVIKKLFLIFLFLPNNKEDMKLLCISKYNSKREIILVITDAENEILL